SNTSSIGLFRTGAMYDGDHGRAIRLYGLDSIFNSNAFIRDIVLHSSWYVSIPTILENLFTFNGPRIGRSNGCFVVSPSVIDEIAETLKEHALLYAYGHTNEP
ncbi:MAG: murein L,D-transpeptidase catalytic domain family protein, partial [Prosthecochloris sp.]|uniref:murein L,D-transpeptidase catalytic domain-containing protein n=1 Tax=Prosthecochloris sp. TaxID=290513 RepID=UPI00258D28AD